MLALATHSTQLKELYIGSCKHVGDKGVTALANHCTELSSVVLSGSLHLTDSGARALLAPKNIKKLKLNWCTQISAEVMELLSAY